MLPKCFLFLSGFFIVVNAGLIDLIKLDNYKTGEKNVKIAKQNGEIFRVEGGIDGNIDLDDLEQLQGGQIQNGQTVYNRVITVHKQNGKVVGVEGDGNEANIDLEQLEKLQSGFNIPDDDKYHNYKQTVVTIERQSSHSNQDTDMDKLKQYMAELAAQGESQQQQFKQNLKGYTKVVTVHTSGGSSVDLDLQNKWKQYKKLFNKAFPNSKEERYYWIMFQRNSKLWEEYKKQFNKSYKTQEEEESHFYNFIENLNLMNKNTANGGDEYITINEYVDLPTEEYIIRYKWEMFKKNLKKTFKTPEEEEKYYLIFVTNYETWTTYKKKFNKVYESPEEEKLQFQNFVQIIEDNKAKGKEFDINEFADLSAKNNQNLLSWEQYKKDYNKVYKSPEEEEKGHENFSKNLLKIKKHNAKLPEGDETSSLTINKFVDLPFEEYRLYSIWEKFKKEFDKVYKSPEEEHQHFQYFKRNIGIIRDHAQKAASGAVKFVVEINEYADLPTEEYDIYYKWQQYKNDFKKKYKSPAEEQRYFKYFITNINKVYKERKAGNKITIDNNLDLPAEDYEYYLLWQQYKKDNNKKYSKSTEEKYFENFKINMKKIQDYNKNVKNVVKKLKIPVNKYVDLPAEEYDIYYQWEEFKNDFDKKYKSPEEEVQHFKDFKVNLIKIRDYNSKLPKGVKPVIISKYFDLPVQKYEIYYQWEQYKNDFGKTYKSSEDEEQHFNNFKRNINKIEEHNKKFSTGEEDFEIPVNQFVDLPAEEYDDFYQWELFKNEFDKYYKSPQEEKQRFKNFKRNLAKIYENKKGPNGKENTTITINKYVDLPADEYDIYIQWEQYKTEFGKTFKSPEDEEDHFENYKNNLIKINQHNDKVAKGEAKHKIIIDKHTDLPKEQFDSFIEWELYKAKFDKVYKSPEEEQKHFHYFKINLIKIREHNKNAAQTENNHVVEVDKYVDLPAEQYENYYRWEHYKKKYNKVYKSPEEEAQHFYYFKINLINIKAQNDKAKNGETNPTVDINEFVDLPFDEFNIRTIWIEYKKQFKKVYKTPEVERTSFNNFRENYYRLKDNNAKLEKNGKKYVIVINQYADLPASEFQNRNKWEYYKKQKKVVYKSPEDEYKSFLEFVENIKGNEDWNLDDYDYLVKWNQYKKDFKKTYKSGEEEQKCYQYFIRNLNEIDEHNKKNPKTKWTLNKYADLPEYYYRTMWENFKNDYQKVYKNDVIEQQRYHNFLENLKKLEGQRPKDKNGVQKYDVVITKYADLSSEEYYNHNKWEQFKKDFNKAYKSPEDEDEHYQNFVKNLLLIEENNVKVTAGNGRHVIKVTKFADLPFKEFNNRNAWEQYKIDFKKTYTTPEDDERHFDSFVVNLVKIREQNNKAEKGQEKFKLVVNEYTDLPVNDYKVYCQWVLYKNEFNKVYKSPEEEQECFENFKTNFEKLAKSNDDNGVTTITINKYFDLPTEEYDIYLQWVKFKTDFDKIYKTSEIEDESFRNFKINLLKIREHNNKVPKGNKTALLTITEYADLPSVDFDIYIQWKQYKTKFNKVYKNSEEELTHFRYFKINLIKMREHNKNVGENDYILTLNQFVDLPTEEYDTYNKWENYKKKFNKVYKTPEEEQQHFYYFKLNLIRMKEQNDLVANGKNNVSLTINEYTDLPAEEFNNHIKWEHYKIQFKKTYKSPKEEQQSYKNFKENLLRIRENNAKVTKDGNRYIIIINEYADLPSNEFYDRIKWEHYKETQHKVFESPEEEYQYFIKFVKVNKDDDWTTDDTEYRVKWEQFKKDYNKVYDSEESEQQHYHNFVKNLIKIAEVNAKVLKGELKYLLVVNQYADLPVQEYYNRNTWDKFKKDFKKVYLTPEDEQHHYHNFIENLERLQGQKTPGEKGVQERTVNINKYADLSIEEYRAHNKWEQFKKDFNKEYDSPEEEDTHFHNFVKNLLIIEEHNAEFAIGKSKYVFRITEYADAPTQEFFNRISWEQFKKDYNKIYNSKEEEEEHYKYFILNLVKFGGQNENSIAGIKRNVILINEYFDLPTEEFQFKIKWQRYKKDFGKTFDTENEERQYYLKFIENEKNDFRGRYDNGFGWRQFWKKNTNEHFNNKGRQNNGYTIRIIKTVHNGQDTDDDGTSYQSKSYKGRYHRGGNQWRQDNKMVFNYGGSHGWTGHFKG